MERKDEGLAFLLRYENVAWFEQGVVKILDRRIYPEKTVYVTCWSWQEVRQAIADMVTQSAGPYTAAGMGMALAAFQVRGKGQHSPPRYCEQDGTDYDRLLSCSTYCLGNRSRCSHCYL